MRSRIRTGTVGPWTVREPSSRGCRGTPHVGSAATASGWRCATSGTGASTFSTRTGGVTSARSTSSRATAAASSSRSRPARSTTFGQPIEAVDHRKLAGCGGWRSLAGGAARRRLPAPRRRRRAGRRRRRAATSTRTLPDRARRRGSVVTLGRTRAVGLRGIVGFVVDVEVDVASGLPAFLVGGCPDGACAQSPDRVKAAAANSGHPSHCAGSR